MRTLRFFCGNLDTDTAVLDQEQSRHLAKVLRVDVGDTVELFDGEGLLADAAVEKVAREQVSLRITHKKQAPRKTFGRVILAVSIAKGERFDWMIEKCTELGADHIAAVHYDHTVKMGKESALARYKKIALAAAKQCGRLYLPVLSGPAGLANTVALLCSFYPDAQLFYGDSKGVQIESCDCLAKSEDKIVFIGPEGGFSEEEYAFFANLNTGAVCINPNVLRVETAAVAFATILCRTS